MRQNLMNSFKSPTTLTSLASAVLLFCAISGRAEPRQDSSLTVEDALKVRSFGQLMDIEFSPDGIWIAVGIQDSLRARSVGEEDYALTGVPEWALGTDICIVNTETGDLLNLTGGNGDNWLPAWSHDGRYLAFVSDRESKGQARLWIWSRQAKQLRQVSNVDVRTDSIQWTADSRNVLLTVVPEGLAPIDYVKKIMSAGESKDSTTESIAGVLRYEWNPGSSNGSDQRSAPWSLDQNLRDLCSVEVASGKVGTIVHNKRVASYLVSPDGLRIAYTSPTRFERAGSQQTLFDLIVVDLRTMMQRVAGANLRFDYDGASFSWSPDGQQLSFQTGGVEEHRLDCYVSDMLGGPPRNITMFAQPALARRKSQPPVWGMRGDLYFIRDDAIGKASTSRLENVKLAHIPDRQILQIISGAENARSLPSQGASQLVLTRDNGGKQDGVYRIDLTTGRSAKLIERGQCYTCGNLRRQITASKDGLQVALLAEDAQHDQDLWISPATFKNPRRLTDLNPQFDKIRMGAARLIEWLSDDGDRLQGTLLLPSNYESGKRFPLVVWIYGGAFLSEDFDRFGGAYRGPFNMQLLATRGYAVLLPDAPQHLGTPMLDLAKTVLPGINKTIEMGIADPDRLGIMGHSYGGYSTLALIVQTGRFKAAIEACGPGDLIGNYGAMNKDGTAFGISIDELGQGLMGGTPWELRPKYIENSPFFYLDRIETPLLIVQGGADDSVGPFLADQLFVSLRRLGKSVEYVKYEGEEHSPLYWSYLHQLDMCRRIISWLDKYLRIPNSTSTARPKDM
jgi:dipeptidyl aminopeptidase/acylaminoacyl peptidase